MSDETQAERPMFKVLFVCWFCGGEDERDFPVDVKQKTLVWCHRCGVLSPRKGLKVRYGAQERSADYAWADQNLTRGEVYTIHRVMRWQHGTNVELAEIEHKGVLSRNRPSFNLLLFTPVGFDVASRRKREATPEKSSEAGFSAVSLILVVLAVAILLLIVVPWLRTPAAEHRELKPHELLAGAIFFGSLFVSGSLDKVAEAIREGAGALKELVRLVKESKR
jgi:hypothetical protein